MNVPGLLEMTTIPFTWSSFCKWSKTGTNSSIIALDNVFTWRERERPMPTFFSFHSDLLWNFLDWIEPPQCHLDNQLSNSSTVSNPLEEKNKFSSSRSSGLSLGFDEDVDVAGAVAVEANRVQSCVATSCRLDHQIRMGQQETRDTWWPSQIQETLMTRCEGLKDWRSHWQRRGERRRTDLERNELNHNDSFLLLSKRSERRSRRTRAKVSSFLYLL